MGAARSWLDSNDVDAASFREHRLLAAVAQRFGTEIAAHPSFPRLAGLARHLWARSQIAQHEAAAALRTLAHQMPVMVIKGASRVAADPQGAKGRVSHDIDILVRRADMARALDVLLGLEWRHMEGESRQRLKASLTFQRAINMGRGALGNIDLHQDAYHAVNASAADDERLWRRAESVDFLGARMLVPAASDRAAVAIGHGALDAHAHSDWLVDCGLTISQPGFDWQAFADTVAARRVEAPAAIALGYLAGPVGLSIPPDLLLALTRSAHRRPIRRLSVALQAAPRENLSRAGHIMRGVAKLWRARISSGNGRGPQARSIRAHRRRAVSGGLDNALLSTVVKVGAEDRLQISLRVQYPAIARRAVFEVNTPDYHVAKLVMRNWSPHERVAEGVFSIPVPSALRGKSLVIEARPSKLIRDSSNQPFRQANQALPFVLSAG